ncbi:MAG: hypothetical protein RIC55_05010 [Pirellulaceae bacterium]
MSGRHTFRSLSLLTLAVLTALAAGGCSSLHPRQLDVLGVFAPRRPSPPAPGAPAYTVVEVPSLGQPDTFAVPLEKPLTVQQALEQTGAGYRFGLKEVYIERTAPEAGKPHKLAVTFAPGGRTISPETDYALYPGDRLIVKEDPTTLMEQTLEGLKP